jgi:predicted GNAT superfamily acetyltransferase
MSEIEIRACGEVEEFQRMVELQKTIWGFADIDLVPLRMFVVASKIGGQVFGAFDGAEMVGFVMAVPGYRHGKSYLHSHMAAVLPAYQNRGVGRQLKLKQRQEALGRGIELVEWTFDPLELKNARFNIERLGAIARRYVRNQYGRTSSPLHGGLPTDRLVAEWWLGSPRVETVVNGGQPPRAASTERIRIPADISELKKSDPKAAGRAQSEAGALFEEWFGKGYAVTGFELDEEAGTYLLEPCAAGPA